MGLSAEQMKKYGLTKTSASAADHDKGIVAHGSGFYQIEGFGHGQEDKLDKDKGQVFGSSLQSDAKAKDSTYDPSSFNTAGDVENALRRIDGGTTVAAKPKEAPELSQTAKKAVAYTKAFEDFTQSGGYVDQEMGNLKARDSFMNDYKLNLQKSMKGRAKGNATATTKSDVADSFLKEKNGG